jgi:hypothetical protein
MKQVKIILVLSFLIRLAPAVFAGDDIIDKVTDGVCNCLEEGKKANLSIENKQYQICIEKATKSYAKQLKKMYLNKDEPNAEQKFASTIAMKLALIMVEKCPDMLEFIMEEMPELQQDN